MLTYVILCAAQLGKAEPWRSDAPLLFYPAPMPLCCFGFLIYLHILDALPHPFIILREQKRPLSWAFLSLKMNRL